MNFIPELRWQPSFADPTFMGWLTVVAYAVGAALAALAARRTEGRDSGGQKRVSTLWVAVTVLMACLCVNKQLYLHSLLTDLGRVAFERQGWYGHRQGLQEWSVVGVLAGAGIVGCWLVLRFHTFWASHRLLVAGSLLLLTLMVVRAISFHPVDVFLHTTILGLRMNRALELTGIALISAAALKERRRPAPGR
ncbi:MAG: hypothetical protein WCF18_05730 [Chthoniobacteraceae bacterium]